MKPRDPITFTTPKGRVLTGTVQFVSSIYLMVKTLCPPMSFLVDKTTLRAVGSGS